MQRCTECEYDKPLDEFYASKSGKNGRASKCKECLRAYQRQYAKTKSARQLRRAREAQQQERIRVYQRDYWRENKERIMEQRKRKKMIQTRDV
jgi:hypothetical protein